MINVQLIGGDKLVAHVQGFWPKLQAATKQSITACLIELTRYVKEQKLSGQVLRNQTGRLRRSIHQSPITVTETEVSGMVGTNVSYGGFWEYGYHGPVTVKQHMRMMVKAWGQPLKNPHQVSVRQHNRQINEPERSFLRSSLRELGPGFMLRLREDLQRALK
jgi:phage gpG-like protein